MDHMGRLLKILVEGLVNVDGKDQADLIELISRRKPYRRFKNLE